VERNQSRSIEGENKSLEARGETLEGKKRSRALGLASRKEGASVWAPERVSKEESKYALLRGLRLGVKKTAPN